MLIAGAMRVLPRCWLLRARAQGAGWDGGSWLWKRVWEADPPFMHVSIWEGWPQWFWRRLCHASQLGVWESPSSLGRHQLPSVPMAGVQCEQWPAAGPEHRILANPMQEFVGRAPETDHVHHRLFHHYKERFGKSYGSEEEHEHRKRTFIHNMRYGMPGGLAGGGWSGMGCPARSPAPLWQQLCSAAGLCTRGTAPPSPTRWR